MIRYALTWIFSKLPRSERGQDLIEYAVLSGLIAIAIMAGVLVFSGAITSMANGISGCIDFTAGGCTPF